MKTTAVGRGAETAVSEYLKKQGYKILEQNWRTRWCEIDIIAIKENTISFIEVKYRSQSAQGSGFEYIGYQKLKKLRFAAELWAQIHKWEYDYCLLGAEVSGLSYEAISLTELD